MVKEIDHLLVKVEKDKGWVEILNNFMIGSLHATDLSYIYISKKIFPPMKPNKDELQKLYDESLVAYTQPTKKPSFDHYIITAWNPMSFEVSDEVNLSANKELEKDFLTAVGKKYFGHCYGYHPDESWREDGFWVSAEAMSLNQIMDLAKKYRQIAIYRQERNERPVIWVEY